MRKRFAGGALSRRGRAAASVPMLAMSLTLGACAQMGGETSGLLSLSKSEPPAATNPKDPQAELRTATAYWGKEFSRNPKDAKAAVAYVQNLKALNRKQEALAVIQQATIYNAEDRALISEYARLALEFGQLSIAEKLLPRAEDPTKPDWRIISARGTLHAKKGEYKDAIPFFERAMELAPEQPSLMNNLALAYTMDGQAEKAEELLKKAVALSRDPSRVNQNLALVLGLQGKYDEAKSVGDKSGKAGDAAENVNLIRQITNAPPRISTPSAITGWVAEVVPDAPEAPPPAPRKAAGRR